MDEYKILCSGKLSFGERGFMEKELVKEINEELHYEAISLGGTDDRICVLMMKKP